MAMTDGTPRRTGREDGMLPAMAAVGLVLGAGGVVGHAYHAATLAVLEQRTGWDPRTADIVVGTSAGSGAAALLRAGLATADLLARVTDRPLSDEARRLLQGYERPLTFDSTPPVGGGRRPPAAPGLIARDLLQPWRMRPGRMFAAALPAGQVSNEELGTRLRALFADGWPAATLWVCALCLEDGERVVFGRDPAPATDVGTAVQASSAIPGWFQPVMIDNRRYVDGGAHSPTSADLLAGRPLDLVVVVSPMSGVRESARPAFGAGAGAGAGARMMHRLTLTSELAQLRRAGTPILVVEPTAADIAAMGPNAMDRARTASVAESARASAAALLDGPQSAGAVAILQAAAAGGAPTP
jgi:NTE family protein